MARVDVNGVGIEYEVTGQGRPVVLLHGFPDSGRLWRHQVPALAAAGFQVDRPRPAGLRALRQADAVEAYSLLLLAGDVIAVLADAGDRAGPRGRPRLGRRPGLGAGVARARHGRPSGRAVGRPPGHLPPHAEQREKSWYMLLFQFPGIAERGCRRTTGPTSGTGPGTPTPTR